MLSAYLFFPSGIIHCGEGYSYLSLTDADYTLVTELIKIPVPRMHAEFLQVNARL
jgi:hypothetical protein